MPPPMTRKSARRDTGCYPTIRVFGRIVVRRPRCPSNRFSSASSPRSTDRHRRGLSRAARCAARPFRLRSPPHRRLSPAVWKLHGETAAGSLGGAPVILIPDGERHKHLRTVSKVSDALVALERRSRCGHHRRGRRRAGRHRRGSRRRRSSAGCPWCRCRRRCSRRSTARSAAKSA